MTHHEPCDPHLDALVAERLQAVRQRIRDAGGVGVEVLAVTKTFPVEACWAAYRAGCIAVGENYAQEVVAKLGERGPVPFGVHFIGQLQSNKVRMLAPLVTCYETIDRESVAREVARRAPGSAVLVQVNTTGEVGKGGCPISGVPALVDLVSTLGLRVRGMMTVGPTEGGPEAARPGFRAVRALCDSHALPVCSMGMTADIEVAVQEGATEVRVGSALFGGRPPATRPVR